MTNQIQTPGFVLRAKESKYFTKNNSLILFILLEVITFVVIHFVNLMASTIPVSFLAGIYAGAKGMNFMDVLELEAFTSLDLISRVIHTVIATLFCIFIQKRKAESLGYTKKNAVSQYLLGLVVGFSIFSAGVLFTIITKTATYTLNNEKINIGLYLALILGWIIQGMSEEVVCRGFFLVSLSRKLPVPAAIFISSFAFAAIHLGNNNLTVLAFINLALFGIFASLVFLRTKNIWFVSAIHSVWNYVQGNFYGIPVSGGFSGPHILTAQFDMTKEVINGGAFGLEGGLAVTIVLVIGCLITVFLPSFKKTQE